MKKFILLMLLTSAMSAHAVGQASEQIDTNQNEDSDENIDKAIALSLVDQFIEEEKKRENALSLSANTQRNNPVGEMQINTFQRNVQQNNSGSAEDSKEEAIRKAIEKENEKASKEEIEKTMDALDAKEVGPALFDDAQKIKREEHERASKEEIEKIVDILDAEEVELDLALDRNQRSAFEGELAPANAGTQEIQINTTQHKVQPISINPEFKKILKNANGIRSAA